LVSAFLVSLMSVLFSSAVRAEGGGDGYRPTTIPTANGGELTVEPATVDLEERVISCRIHGYDGNSQTGMVRVDIPFHLEVEIPPFPSHFENLPEAERLEAEREWVRVRIAPLTRPELWPCLYPALMQRFGQDYRDSLRQQTEQAE
jgi:hypothetical protein